MLLVVHISVRPSLSFCLRRCFLSVPSHNEFNCIWLYQVITFIHLQFLAFELDIIQSAFLIYKDTCTIYMYMWRHLWNIFLVCYQSLCEQPLYPVLWSLKHVFPSYWLPGNHHIVAVSFFNFPWTFSFISCKKKDINSCHVKRSITKKHIIAVGYIAVSSYTKGKTSFFYYHCIIVMVINKTYFAWVLLFSF